MPTGLKPEFNVSDKAKLTILSELMPIIIGLLGKESGGVAVSGDDVIDFLALATAALHDQDDYLKTPRDLRLAAETSAVHILRRLKDFRVETDATGDPWMVRALKTPAVRGRPSPGSPSSH